MPRMTKSKSRRQCYLILSIYFVLSFIVSGLHRITFCLQLTCDYTAWFYAGHIWSQLRPWRRARTPSWPLGGWSRTWALRCRVTPSLWGRTSAWVCGSAMIGFNFWDITSLCPIIEMLLYVAIFNFYFVISH